MPNGDASAPWTTGSRPGGDENQKRESSRASGRLSIVERLLVSERFRAWATRFPLTRPIARRRSRALFDLCAGFVYSQTLFACVELRLFDLLAAQDWTDDALARRLDLTPERLARLMRAAESLRLVRRARGHWRMGALGASLVGNDGVAAMIRHHAMLYADLADPVALLRAPPGETQLAQYWPYATTPDPAALQPGQVADYSALMAASQPMVAATILDAYDLRPHRCLLDVGGGEGAFLAEAAARAPSLRLALLDLPAVAARAASRLGAKVSVTGADMLAGPWPAGADVISLIRVLHDHDDSTVQRILQHARAALPQGGTLLVGEPMDDSSPVGAAYFGFYLLALGTGRARRPEALMHMLQAAGFRQAHLRPTANPLIARLIVAST